MRANELRGKTVLSVAQAERLGQVDDVALDLTNCKVLGLWLSAATGGIFSAGESRYVPADLLHSIGADAITVKASPDTDTMRAYPDEVKQLPRLSHLRGARAVSEAGTLLGEVTGMEFDPKTMQIQGYYVTPKSRRDGERLLPATSVISHGEQLLMVNQDGALQMDLDAAFSQKQAHESR